MRIPYVVGRWVRDRNHYGRQRLFNHLLNTQDAAIWVVGARRIGKTSLLRQLEFLTDSPNSTLIPLFWDLQGCESSGDLSFELYLAMEDVSGRFTPLGIDVTSLEGLDASVLLRRVSRSLEVRTKTLFLLVDEAEVLIKIARQEPAWLARLRKTLQDGAFKTVITSTKLLAQLNDITAAWETSPFLFGFNMVNLWSLDMDSATALIEQKQAHLPIRVEPAVLEDIVAHTNRHPYLIQFLCQRLYSEDGNGISVLRAPAEEDLEPDQLLAGFFAIDFQHLTRLERRLVLTVAKHSLVSEAELLAELADEMPARIRTFLWGLEKLGHLRQVFGQWAIGNEFLRRWLQHEADHLACCDETPLDDRSVEEMLRLGHVQEDQAFHLEVARLEAAYSALCERYQRANGGAAPELRRELEQVSAHLTAARRDSHRTFQSGGWRPFA